MFSISVCDLSIHLLSQGENLEATLAVRHQWPICKSEHVTGIVNKNEREEIKLVAKLSLTNDY